jgi:hypothetical protein
LVIESILTMEWLQTYLPTLAAVLNWFAAQVFPTRRGLLGEDDMQVSQ